MEILHNEAQGSKVSAQIADNSRLKKKKKNSPLATEPTSNKTKI